MVNQGFPKLSRLLNAKDYSPVFKQPDYRVSNRYFLFLVLGSDTPSSRLGIVVAKKNISKAVQRNRIKRIIRETFRANKFDLGTIDLVVLARKNLDLLSSKEIHAQLETLFKELKQKAAKTVS